MEGRAPRALPNQSELVQRPITALLVWQICPAVRGGAARVPGPPVTLLRALQKSTGQWAEKPGGGGAGRPRLCVSLGTPAEAPMNERWCNRGTHVCAARWHVSMPCGHLSCE